jgi:hypothetical protein
MLKYRGWIMLSGFVLFVLGFTGLAMMLLGLNWAFLTWLDYFGRTLGMILRLVMIMIGIMMFVASNIDWEKEKRESE